MVSAARQHPSLTLWRVLGLAGGAALLGCAGRPTPKSLAEPTAVAPAPSPCLVADTTARTTDTVYVVGVTAPAFDIDCEGQDIKPGPQPVVVPITPATGADLRDLMDRGVPDGTHRPDVVITRDPALIEYATRRADYFTVALPWDRTYVLAARDSLTWPSEAERDALSRDAVRGESRGGNEFYPFGGGATCSAPHGAAAHVRAFILYPADDDMARQLAERVVALATSPGRPGWIPRSLQRTPKVLPTSVETMDRAVASGAAAAAVYPITQTARAGCFGHGIVPLVDSRATAIVRRGSGAAFIVGADASLTFITRGAP